MTKKLSLIRWLGSKTRMSSKILPLFDDINRTLYVEPFGGAAAILLNKEPERAEIYNDINGLLVNLFRVIRRKSAEKDFKELGLKTPKSRAIFYEYCNILKAYRNNPESAKALVEQANLCDYDFDTAVAFCLFYNQNLNFGGRMLTSYGGGEKGAPQQAGNTNNGYRRKIDNIQSYCERFRTVEIENLDAIDCIKKYDEQRTLFYLDPPYDSKSSVEYKTPFDADREKELVDVLIGLKGSAVLSCYDNERYEVLLEHGYRRYKFDAVSSICERKDATMKRVETVYKRIAQGCAKEKGLNF